MDEKEKHLRWMEGMWERYQSITFEEKRKEEVLGIFEELAEISKRPMGMSRLPRRRGS